MIAVGGSLDVLKWWVWNVYCARIAWLGFIFWCWIEDTNSYNWCAIAWVLQTSSTRNLWYSTYILHIVFITKQSIRQFQHVHCNIILPWPTLCNLQTSQPFHLKRNTTNTPHNEHPTPQVISIPMPKAVRFFPRQSFLMHPMAPQTARQDDHDFQFCEGGFQAF